MKQKKKQWRDEKRRGERGKSSKARRKHRIWKEKGRRRRKKEENKNKRGINEVK